MPDALSVELKLLGIEQAGRDLSQFAQELRRFNEGGSGGSGSGGALSQEKQLAQLTKIRQDAQLRNEKQLAQARKDRLKQEAGEEKQQRQEGINRFKQLVKPDSGGIWKDVDRLFKSSRISLGGGSGGSIMPLVGNLEKVFGEVSGPAGIAATALMALEESSRHAAAVMMSFRQAELISGGTAKEVSEAELIGKFLGLDKKDVAKEARSFSDRITSDPYAQAYAARMGVTDVPGLANGKIDKIQGLLDFIDKLRQLPNEEAIRAARATGTEDFLPLRDLDEGRYRQMKQYAQQRAGMFGDGKGAAGRTFDDAMAEQGREDGYTRIGNGFNQFSENGAGLYNGSRHADSTAYNRDNATLENERQAAQQNHTSALNQNTQALQGLNQLIRAGIYGGGERTQGAIPAAFMGAGWQNKQLRAQAHALGAFGV